MDNLSSCNVCRARALDALDDRFGEDGAADDAMAIYASCARRPSFWLNPAIAAAASQSACPLLGADAFVVDDIFYLEGSRRTRFSLNARINVRGAKLIERKSGSASIQFRGAAAALLELEIAQSCAPNLAGYRRG